MNIYKPIPIGLFRILRRFQTPKSILISQYQPCREVLILSKLDFLIMHNSLTKLNTLALLNPLAFMHTIPTTATKLHFHTPYNPIPPTMHNTSNGMPIPPHKPYYQDHITNHPHNPPIPTAVSLTENSKSQPKARGTQCRRIKAPEKKCAPKYMVYP